MPTFTPSTTTDSGEDDDDTGQEKAKDKFYETLFHINRNIFKLNNAKTTTVHDWVNYQGFESFIDLITEYQSDPFKLEQAMTYKKNDTTYELQQAVVSKIRLFIFWCNEYLENHPECDTITSTTIFENLSKDVFDTWKIKFALHGSSENKTTSIKTHLTTYSSTTNSSYQDLQIGRAHV